MAALSGAHFFRSRGRQQPSGQSFFADTGSSRAQQLEERPLAEQIQIARVRVRRVKEPVAGLSGSGPLVLDSGQTARIEIRDAHDTGQSADHAVVRDDRGPRRSKEESGAG